MKILKCKYCMKCDLVHFIEQTHCGQCGDLLLDAELTLKEEQSNEAK